MKAHGEIEKMRIHNFLYPKTDNFFRHHLMRQYYCCKEIQNNERFV
jgi:hypothetical protein